MSVDPMTFCLVRDPITIVNVTIGEDDPSLALDLVLYEVALKNRAVLPCLNALSMSDFCEW